MTEAEWLACTFPGRMLDHLRVLGGVTDRRLRLAACACLRLVWDDLPVTTVRAAIEVGERFLDGEASLEELNDARERASHDASRMSHSLWLGTEQTGRDVWYAVAMDPVGRGLWGITAHYTWVSSTIRGLLAFRTQRRESRLLRDIFGNPFRPVAFLSEWRTSTVLALARQMYDARDFTAMPILADALQDAGCDSPDILDHCRGAGPHARGCWVVDLVLGKE